MNRIFSKLAIAGLLLSSNVFAGNTFKDVPANHWAYKAIEKVANAGVIVGYKENFNGEHKLSRYEMAIIVSRLLDAVSKGANIEISDKEILAKLTGEFQNELALLGARVDALQARTDFNDGRIESLEEDMQVVKEMNPGNKVASFKFSGKLDFMWQSIFADGFSDTLTSNPNMRARLDLNGRTNDKVTWGISLYTANDYQPSSSWRVFGDDSEAGNNGAFNSNSFKIWKYYLNYKATEDLTLTFGKQKNVWSIQN